MKYSIYTEKIMSDPRYLEHCKLLMEMVKDKTYLPVMEGVLYEGGYDGFNISSQLGEKDNPDMESHRRLWMGYLLATNPEAFETIVKNNAILFHGTNANALPSILTHGIMNFADARDSGVDVVTGEVTKIVNAPRRKFTSFTNSYATALNYTTIDSSDKSSPELAFGVMLGISPEDLKKLSYSTEIQSEVSEIGVYDTIPTEFIKFIGVPESKVDFVKRMIGDKPIDVVSLEMPEQRLQMFHLYAALRGEPSPVNHTNKKEPTFQEHEVKALSKERHFSAIRKIYNDLKNKLFNRRKDYDKSKEVENDR